MKFYSQIFLLLILRVIHKMNQLWIFCNYGRPVWQLLYNLAPLGFRNLGAKLHNNLYLIL